MVELKDKKMLVVGAGISGIAAAKMAKKMGAAVVLSDAKAEANIKFDLQVLRSIGVEVVLGPQQESLLDGVDVERVVDDRQPAWANRQVLLQIVANRS